MLCVGGVCAFRYMRVSVYVLVCICICVGMGMSVVQYSCVHMCAPVKGVYVVWGRRDGRGNIGEPRDYRCGGMSKVNRKCDDPGVKEDGLKY